MDWNTLKAMTGRSTFFLRLREKALGASFRDERMEGSP